MRKLISYSFSAVIIMSYMLPCSMTNAQESSTGPIRTETLIGAPINDLWNEKPYLLAKWDLKSSWLQGKDRNAVQSIAFDTKENKIYALYDTKIMGGSSVIYSIPLRDSKETIEQPNWGAGADVRVGHQGLAVEHNNDGKTYLWTSKRNKNSNNERDNNSGAKVIRFPVTGVPSFSTARNAKNQWTHSDGKYFKHVQEYTLWPDKKRNQNAQPTISEDQKYLITKMTGKKDFTIRVFSLDELVRKGPGDYSNDYLKEFKIPKSSIYSQNGIRVIQGIASDGQYIYVSGGRMKSSPKEHINILAYDMLGNFVSSNQVYNIGYNEQLKEAPTSKLLEDESINIVRIGEQKKLVLQIAGGNLGDRTEWLYVLN